MGATHPYEEHKDTFAEQKKKNYAILLLDLLFPSKSSKSGANKFVSTLKPHLIFPRAMSTPFTRVTMHPNRLVTCLAFYTRRFQVVSNL